MSLLIQLRYRIKAIETIKKITHAMRLISMSSRSRLKSKEDPMREYIQTMLALISRIKPHAPEWRNPILHPQEAYNPLVILVGSQRGLCGNFNTVLFHFFEKIVSKPLNGGTIQIIPVGKKAVNYIDDNPLYTIIARYPELHAKTYSTIAQDIVQKLLHTEPRFTHVTVFSNTLKTFFIQKPIETQLIPYALKDENPNQIATDYYWEQSPKVVLDQLILQMLEMQMQYLLFESLIAEHAARFISMDNATRNAQTLLEDTQLQYNKLRQAKITKELTELVSNM